MATGAVGARRVDDARAGAERPRRSRVAGRIDRGGGRYRRRSVVDVLAGRWAESGRRLDETAGGGAMIRRWVAAVGITAAIVRLSAQDQAVFHGSADLVTLDVAATRNGRPVRDLKLEEFEVLDNG